MWLSLSSAGSVVLTWLSCWWKHIHDLDMFPPARLSRYITDCERRDDFIVEGAMAHWSSPVTSLSVTSKSLLSSLHGKRDYSVYSFTLPNGGPFRGFPLSYIHKKENTPATTKYSSSLPKGGRIISTKCKRKALRKSSGHRSVVGWEWQEEGGYHRTL
jgi:hypothetical protein